MGAAAPAGYGDVDPTFVGPLEPIAEGPPAPGQYVAPVGTKLDTGNYAVGAGGAVIPIPPAVTKPAATSISINWKTVLLVGGALALGLMLLGKGGHGRKGR